MGFLGRVRLQYSLNYCNRWNFFVENCRNWNCRIPPDFSVNVTACSQWLLQEANWNPAGSGGTERVMQQLRGREGNALAEVTGWAEPWLPAGHTGPNGDVCAASSSPMVCPGTHQSHLLLQVGNLMLSSHQTSADDETNCCKLIWWIVANSASQHFAVDTWILLAAGHKTK